VKKWYPLEIARDTETISGEVQIPTKKSTRLDIIEEITDEQVSQKASNFFTVLKEACSTNANKKTVTYNKDEAGVYREQ
jgi:hypothetical protein